jgi:trk system potassium uptake protein
MFFKNIHRVREFLNLRIYSSKASALFILQVLSAIVTTSALGSIIYYYGFPKTAESADLCLLILKISFMFYIFRYFIRIIYEFKPLQYIKQTWFEGLFVFLLLVNGIFVELFNASFFEYNSVNQYFSGFGVFTILLTQGYFVVILFIDMAKIARRLGVFKLGPSELLSFSFVILILSGAGLLMLPEMTVNHAISFVDALFTSTSASCVTGLVTVDTATFFTIKGKIIIMVLIQLGGLNIITFAAFFATFYRESGIKYQSLLKDMFSSDRVADTRNTLRNIILSTVIIEAIGAFMIFNQWTPCIPFDSTKEKIFYSVFHCISAFNNAGFSLFSNGLYEEVVRNSYYVHITIAFLIILGGIGFPVLTDLFSIRSIRERVRSPWKGLKIHTKIVLYTTLVLIVSGMVLFYFLEKDNAVDNSSPLAVFTSCFFQSVTTRTAGFNTVDFTHLGQPILIVFIVLMFIGASPVSTGGGIKTTTFAILFKSSMATIRGKKNIEIFKRNIPFEIIDRAYSILLFSISLVIVSVFLLTITEPDKNFLNLLFEEVSAFGTVGLSTGITFFLTTASKYILITSMFVGRIGPLTLALALVRRVNNYRYKYPDANIIIG